MGQVSASDHLNYPFELGGCPRRCAGELETVDTEFVAAIAGCCCFGGGDDSDSGLALELAVSTRRELQPMGPAVDQREDGRTEEEEEELLTADVSELTENEPRRREKSKTS
ncbi:predicted protein [Aspergillus terreus NIH2624]|uniref:Uncharacterized protein n=1 Tax=Aspergillus terreus (strain NIH 2624 / FGSC A1156) TaxID=341663 RepID=Q0CRL9_ASPTN|nr:uncharacterized protein ATEG_03665 [Aspergillus terreus NIH2624]EAU35467.1 predicted protein [Aspergillus terreus NIH2624]